MLEIKKQENWYLLTDFFYRTLIRVSDLFEIFSEKKCGNAIVQFYHDHKFRYFNFQAKEPKNRHYVYFWPKRNFLFAYAKEL